jgi:hypothetical protein
MIIEVKFYYHAVNYKKNYTISYVQKSEKKYQNKLLLQEELLIMRTKVGLHRRNSRQRELKEIFTVGTLDKKNQKGLASSELPTRRTKRDLHGRDIRQ